MNIERWTSMFIC